MSLLSDIRDDYIRRFRSRAGAEAAHFSMGSIEKRVLRAAIASTSGGGMHKHQWRIPPSVLKRFSERLMECLPEIKRAKTFAELLAVVDAARIKGIGKLTTYDTAVRIGAAHQLEPKTIYLHAGTRKGAKRLGLNVSRASIPRGELPVELQSLTPAEVEDLLCIYARYFGTNAKTFKTQACSVSAKNDCSTIRSIGCQ